MRPRNESIRRLLTLARQLEPLQYAPPIEELAWQFKVHPRTIRRDLELLESVGYRVPKWRDVRRKAVA